MSPTPRRIERRLLFAPSPGTERSLTVVRYGQSGARPKAYLQAALHADETPGMLVLHHLQRLLDDIDGAGRIHGEIVLVPVANPVGLGQYALGNLLGRFELQDGGNFNRGYPDVVEAVAARVANALTDDAQANVSTIRAAAVAALGELTARTEMDSLQHTLLGLAIDADIALDLHCDNEGVLHVYLGTPLWPDAADLSAQLGAHAALLALDSGGNPFDEACGGLWWSLAERFPAHPIPPACLASTIELRGQADVRDDLARADAENLFRFLARRGIIDADPGPLPPALCEATPLEGADVIRAPHAGIVVFHRHPGERVAAGEIIGEIVDPLAADPAAARTPLVSRAAGVLFAHRRDRMARPGQRICNVAGQTPLPDRKGDLLSP